MLRLVCFLITITALCFAPLEHTKAGQFFTCNGCSLNSMRMAAAARGVGEHLVINVTGRSGIIVTVSCGGPLDRPEEGKGESTKEPIGETFNGCGTDVRWSTEDQLALDFLLDGMRLDGTWAKDVTMPWHESIYDVAQNPGVSIPGIADALSHNVLTYTPGAMSWGGLVSWVQSWSNVASNGEIRVIIQFPDGTMHARISMSWLGHSIQPGLGDITILVTTARDADGNIVPNLTNPDGNLHNATFTFFGRDVPPTEWVILVERLGFTVVLDSGLGTSVWRCTEIRDQNGNVISRECLRD